MERTIARFANHDDADAADDAYYERLTPAERLQLLFDLVFPPDAPVERLARVCCLKRRRSAELNNGVQMLPDSVPIKDISTARAGVDKLTREHVMLSGPTLAVAHEAGEQ